MKLVESFTDLVQLLPKLLKLYEQLDGKWFRFRSKEEFSAKLLEVYSNGARVYAEEAPSDGFLYFAVVVKETEESAYWWLLYVNPSYRGKTRAMVKRVLYELKKEGVTEIFCSTVRTTSSYRRWIEKNFNATLYANVYRAQL